MLIDKLTHWQTCSLTNSCLVKLDTWYLLTYRQTNRIKNQLLTHLPRIVKLFNSLTISNAHFAKITSRYSLCFIISRDWIQCETKFQEGLFTFVAHRIQYVLNVIDLNQLSSSESYTNVNGFEIVLLRPLGEILFRCHQLLTPVQIIKRIKFSEEERHHELIHIIPDVFY